MLTPETVQPVIRTANFFTPAALREWGPRSIPDFELILVVFGELLYAEENCLSREISAGSVLCIPPEVSHSLQCVSRETTISCIHLELSPVGPWVTGAYELAPFPDRVTVMPPAPLMTELFRETARVYTGFSSLRGKLLENLVRQIWLMLAENWAGGGRGIVSGRVQEMVKYLRRHLRDPVSRADLARTFSITPQHVNAIFKKELRMTPTQVHHREKIFHAVRCIQQENTPIKVLAEELGFSDVAHFSRVFKKVMDVPPGKIR